jgi:hypothetical protein
MYLTYSKFRSAIFLFILATCFSFSAQSQKINAKASIDSTHILLGDPIKYNLEVSYNKTLNVILPVFPDTFKGFVVLERSAIDSTFNNDIITRKQTITLTTFDSGDKFIPSVKINYQQKGKADFNFLMTDSFKVIVNYVPVDTAQAIKPIKSILKAPLSFREILPYLISFIILVLIVFTVIYYIKRLKANKPFFVREKIIIPPHIIALEKLKKLEDEKLWQKGEIKKFHIDLTDIIREYMERRFNILAVESTTHEIITQLNNLPIDKNLLNKLNEFLSISDLVKFAKLLPLPNENENCLNVSFEFIDKTKVEEIVQEEIISNPEEPTA